MGVAAMASLPMYLNTTASNLKSPDDLTAKDKIAVTAIKVSIPAILLQMYAEQKYGASQVTRFDKYTVTMTHPDAMTALLAARAELTRTSLPRPFTSAKLKTSASAPS
jgi:NitT/TauT family transport system substrate-binding protein